MVTTERVNIHESLFYSIRTNLQIFCLSLSYRGEISLLLFLFFQHVLTRLTDFYAVSVASASAVRATITSQAVSVNNVCT